MTLRILLAESNITAQTMGMKILVAAGHNVVTVSNGVAAVKKITEVQLDVVLLDIYLPGCGGIEICEKMKATPQMKQISVLLTVGKMDPFRTEEGIKAKADGFIIKPFETSHLIPLVGKLAQRVRPPEAAMSPCITVPKFGNSAYQPPRQSKGSESVDGPESTVAAERAPSAFSRQQSEQICDVCGCVNRKDAFVCQRCDVPLPSSVTSFRLGASRVHGFPIQAQNSQAASICASLAVKKTQ